MWLVVTFNYVTMLQGVASASVHARANITRYQPALEKAPAFIEYSYEVDGKAYVGRFNGHLTVTDGEIDIWYKPDAPYDSVLASPDLMFNLFVGGYLVLSLGFLLVVRMALRRRAKSLPKARELPI